MMSKLKIVESLTMCNAKITPELPYHILMFDGGSRGNPGPAGAGYVIYYGDKEVAHGYKYIGIASNNEAEYTALICGLHTALDMGVERLLIKGDSLLVINQVIGKWDVKAAHLRPLCLEAALLLTDLIEFSIKHVKRNQNKRADTLANQAMDTKTEWSTYI